MDIFSVLTLLGGLALFLYGMEQMGDGLAKASGGKLEMILEKLTSNPIKAVLLGAVVTGVIQSSSATTVMVVGFVNSGIMKLEQAVGIIMGANIGTTATAWILSLAGIESENLFLQFLKPSSFSPILALVGVGLLMFSKKDKKQAIGTVLIGFAVLMTGMETMSSAVEPLADIPEFTNILLMFSNPILGVLCGTALTAVIQSSSASVGILQALCMTGAVTFGTALPIIMGQNIGTCVTALLSAIGAQRNAKRAALIHLSFNMIGTTVFLVVFYTVNSFVHFSFLTTPATAAGIAVVHSAFNVCTTLLLLPFSAQLVRLARILLPETKQEKEATNEEDFQLLDQRFLDTPGYAAEQSRTVAVRMAAAAERSITEAIGLLKDYQEETAEDVRILEQRVDRYEDVLGTYLVKLSAKALSEKDSHLVSTLLHCIGDLERISDHAVNVLETAAELHEKNMTFSKSAQEELGAFSGAVMEIVSTTFGAFEKADYQEAKKVEAMEQAIKDLNQQLRVRHVERLRTGECTMEQGFVMSDLTTNYERIAAHCSNIAIAMVQSETAGYEAHEYAAMLRRETNPEFQDEYRGFREKYSI